MVVACYFLRLEGLAFAVKRGHTGQIVVLGENVVLSLTNRLTRDSCDGPQSVVYLWVPARHWVARTWATGWYPGSSVRFAVCNRRPWLSFNGGRNVLPIFTSRVHESENPIHTLYVSKETDNHLTHSESTPSWKWAESGKPPTSDGDPRAALALCGRASLGLGANERRLAVRTNQFPAGWDSVRP